MNRGDMYIALLPIQGKRYLPLTRNAGYRDSIIRIGDIFVIVDVIDVGHTRPMVIAWHEGRPFYRHMPVDISSWAEKL